MSEPYQILKITLDRERRVKELKDSDARAHEKEIVELVNKVRKAYRTLIVDHPAFVYDPANGSQATRDNANLIAEFRSSLRKHSVHLDSLVQSALPATNQVTEGARQLSAAAEVKEREQAERIYIARLNNAFLSFLADSVAFYQKVVAELEDKARTSRTASTGAPKGGVAAATSSELTVSRNVKSIHRCLLCLGDLCRYKEMYSDKDSKEFLESQRYYERAALIQPHSGNAHNQMAVLATYSDAECAALYHYCRSILSLQPFAGGFENLALLFENNAQAFRKLAPLPAKGNISSAKSTKSRMAVPLKPFLTRFVYLHGLLFAHTTSVHQSYAQVHENATQESAYSAHSSLPLAQNTPVSASQTSWVPVLKSGLPAHTSNSGGDIEHQCETFTALLRQVLDEYETHLTVGTLPDALLVQLLAICLFSVHYAVGREANLLAYIAMAGTQAPDSASQKQERTSELAWLADQCRHCAEQPQRTFTECLALQMLFGVISRTATRINEMMAASEKGCRSTMNRTLPMLGVFADWLGSQLQYLSTPDAPVLLHSAQGTTADSSADSDIAPPALFADSTTGTVVLTSAQWEYRYLASAELLRMETRARSGVRASLSALREVLAQDLQSNEHHKAGIKGVQLTKEEPVQFLREHIELRGFLPVAVTVEKSFSTFDPLSKSLNVMSEPLSRYNRQTSVLALISTVASATTFASAVQPTPADSERNQPAALAADRGKRGRKHRSDDAHIPTTAATSGNTASAIPHAADSSAPKRGPPALPSHVSYAPGGHAADHAPEEMLVPSHADFPELPQRPRPQASTTALTTADVNTAAASTVNSTNARLKTAQQLDEELALELELNDNVVFKSAFLRAGQSNHASTDQLTGLGVGTAAALPSPPSASTFAQLSSSTAAAAAAAPPGMSLLDALYAASTPRSEDQQSFSFPSTHTHSSVHSAHSSTHSLNYSYDNHHSSNHSLSHSLRLGRGGQDSLNTSVNMSDCDNDGDLFSSLDIGLGLDLSMLEQDDTLPGLGVATGLGINPSAPLSGAAQIGAQTSPQFADLQHLPQQRNSSFTQTSDLWSPSSASFFVINSAATPAPAGNSGLPLSSLFQQDDFDGYWNQLSAMPVGGTSGGEQSRLFGVGASFQHSRLSAPWSFAQDDTARSSPFSTQHSSFGVMPSTQHSSFTIADVSGLAGTATANCTQQSTLQSQPPLTAVTGSVGVHGVAPPPGLASAAAPKRPPGLG